MKARIEEVKQENDKISFVEVYYTDAGEEFYRRSNIISDASEVQEKRDGVKAMLQQFEALQPVYTTLKNLEGQDITSD
jgi:hypothetical protein